MRSPVLIGCFVIVSISAFLSCAKRRPDSGPAAMEPPTCSVSPAQGTGFEQRFTITCSDPRGYTHIEDIGLLFNSSMDGANACYVHYLPQLQELRLVTDSGTGTQHHEIGGTDPIENSACAIDPRRLDLMGKESTLSFGVDVKFKPSFAGVRNIYLLGQGSGARSTGLELRGVWRVK